MKRRLLSITLAGLMAGSLVVSLPVSGVKAVDSSNVIDIDYNYQVSGDPIIKKDGEGHDLYSYDVTKYGERVLVKWLQDTEVIRVDDVDYIGTNAFIGLSKVKTVNISGVKYINSHAFNQLESLINVNLDKCSAIGDNAFFACSKLTTLNLGNSIKHLGNSITDWCGSLNSIVLPTKIEDLSLNAFTNTSIQNIYFDFDPSEVNLDYTGNVIYQGSVYYYNSFSKQLRLSGFQYNSASARVLPKVFGTQVTVDTSIQNSSTLRELDLSNLTNVNLPSADLFNRLSFLTKISLPSDLTIDLSNSASIKNDPDLFVEGISYKVNSAIKSIDQTGIDKTLEYKNVTIPSTLFELPVTSINNLSGMIANSLTISDGINNFSPSFLETAVVGKVTLPSTLKELPKYSFNNCNVKEVVLPTQLESIGDSCFKNCKELTNLTLPSTLKSIGTSAFEDSGLNSITLPNNSITVSDRAFSVSNKSLDTFEAPNSFGITAQSFGDVTTINNLRIDDRFLNFYIPELIIKNVKTPSTTLHLENGAYIFDTYTGTSENYEVPATILGKSIVSVSDSAFLDNKTLKTLKVSEGVKNIGNCAFLRCTNLEELALPSTIETLGVDFFGGSRIDNFISGSYRYRLDGKTLEVSGSVFPLSGDVVLPSSYGGRTITSIGKEAFKDSNLITSVKIPDTIVNVKAKAFSDCDTLHNVIIGSSIRTISDYAFNSPEINSVKINSNSDSVSVADTAFKKGTSVEYTDKTIVVGSSTPVGDPTQPTGDSSNIISLMLLFFGSSLLYIVKKLRRVN